jgi:FcoT-like thioesterase domain
MSALSVITRPHSGNDRPVWMRTSVRPTSDAWDARDAAAGPLVRLPASTVRSSQTEQAVSLPLDVPAAFLGKVLTPYRPNARYLESARIESLGAKQPVLGSCGRSCATCKVRSCEGIANKTPPAPIITDAASATPFDAGRKLFTATGTFSIGNSCYIEDTGHFNAVEFNICFNQLAYVAFAKCIDEALVPELAFLDFDGFQRGQLPSWLIVGIDGVRFSKQLDRRAFSAELTVVRMSSVRGTKFFFTTIAFSDSEGVKTSGSVVLSYNGSDA